VGSNAIIVMVGDLNQAQATQLSNTIIAGLPEGVSAPPIPSAQPELHTEAVAIPFSSTQTVIRLGELGIKHQDPNYFPLLIGNYIFGGGAMVSRLAVEIREKEGLSYNANSQFIPMPGNGPFIIGLSTQTQQTEQALTITKKTLRQFLDTGPTEKELVDAKQYLAGNFTLSLASNSNIAITLLRIAFYNLPDNYLDTYIAHLENVSIEDIKKAFSEQIKPDNLLQITVGKPE
jgi:zinc protease